MYEKDIKKTRIKSIKTTLSLQSDKHKTVTVFIELSLPVKELVLVKN